jgi:ferredoxin
MANTSALNCYHILDHCIACTTCSRMAPSVFALNKDNCIAIVKQQPTHSIDHKKSFLALKSCPVSAIGIHS